MALFCITVMVSVRCLDQGFGERLDDQNAFLYFFCVCVPNSPLKEIKLNIFKGMEKKKTNKYCFM